MSEIPPLPTPDFSSTPVKDNSIVIFPGHLSRAFSYFTGKQTDPKEKVSSLPPLPPDYPKPSGSNQPARPRFEQSFEVGITRKFTRRWPRPQAVRHLSSISSSSTQFGDLVSIASEEPALTLERPTRWTTHKWVLLASIVMLIGYGAVVLVYSILVWFGVIQYAEVSYATDYDVLVLSTLAGSLLVFSSLVGITGTLLNSRPILAIYALLLWPAFTALLAVIYLAYRRVTFSLISTLDSSWTHHFNDATRLAIQNALHCCGYTSPLHSASPSLRCYARSPLPGCKGTLLHFERTKLIQVWQSVFALVPLHLYIMIAALLCANHVDKRFGKGIMPRNYWLSTEDVRREAERLGKKIKVAPPEKAFDRGA
ncbi:hypothetical protein HYDPIDRAFT_101011 [Hydnomerulius pinastri MD-312]|uniref:Tetraspanin Tsp2 n=1 Tax=Hydnomerulius pinastri MD-312 TaxID=994086 RepID=A0A0C9W0A7_9AGAM|nr:hypothetical protein HYDPIDRAFT_101011 [Hydnomerulius pinastri MD-312]